MLQNYPIGLKHFSGRLIYVSKRKQNYPRASREEDVEWNEWEWCLIHIQSLSFSSIEFNYNYMHKGALNK